MSNAAPSGIPTVPAQAPPEVLLDLEVQVWMSCLGSETAVAGRRGPSAGAPSPYERCAGAEARVRQAWARLPEAQRTDASADAFIGRTYAAMRPELDRIYQSNNYE